MTEKLQGQLKKLGVKGPRRTWKKRFFIQKEETKLFYYVNEKSSTHQGFISLEDALGVDSTVDTGISGKRNFCFQINTPKRIYHLQADSEDKMKYWMDGINRILQKINNKDQPPTDSMTSKQLERAENRIEDLEEDVRQLRAGLELACKELKTTPENVMLAASQKTPLKLSFRSNSVEDDDDDVAKAEEKEPKAEEPMAEEPKAEEPKAEEEPAKEEPKAQEEAASVVEAVEPEEEAKAEPAVEAASDDAVSDGESSDEELMDAGGKDHFPAKVLYEYSARKTYELSVQVDEVITVLSKHENGWWLGCNRDGKQGYFPGSYVEPISK